MNLETIFTDTYTGVAQAVDETSERWASQTPAPVGTLVRRIGALNAEGIRQGGRISVTTVEALCDLANFTWTGANDVARTVQTATDTSVETLRTTGRRMAGDAKQATSTITNRARSASGTIDRSLSVVGDRAEATGKKTARAAGRTTDQVVKAVDTGAAKTAAAAASTPSGAYENWTKDELYDRAQELEIDGRSGMSKSQLIKALRSA